MLVAIGSAAAVAADRAHDASRPGQISAEARSALGNAVSLAQRAGALEQEGKFAEAETLYREALAIYIASAGENHPQTATCYVNLAENLIAQNKRAEAEPLQRKSLAIREEALGGRDPATIRVASALATTLEHQGKNSEAEPLRQKNLAALRQTEGERSLQTARAYSELATTLAAQGRFIEAEPGPDDFKADTRAG